MNRFNFSFSPHRRSGGKNWQQLLEYPKRFWSEMKRNTTRRKKLLLALIFGGGAVLIAGSLFCAVLAFTLPNPSKLESRIVAQSTKIYARDGQTLLYEIHGEAKRTVIPFENIPDQVKQAAIAIEDKNFYSNKGISITGIIRSVLADVSTGSKSQGGSTITQQFVKNAILTREKSYTRKLKEVMLAMEIDEHYSKDEILSLYLNEIPYGQNAYGIEAAAQTYFGKNADKLSLAEAAYLAALPQAPSFYNPNGPNRARLDARKNLVLQLMHEQGYISEEQKTQAQAEEVAFSKIKTAILAPHFALYVQSYLAEKYGDRTLEEGGLKVITTLDWNLQQIAEKAIADGVARNERSYRAENASLVAVDPKTGQILAMVGSRDYFDDEHDGQFNVAIAERQPGSSFKPYVYLAAFRQGMSPATMLVDVETNFGTYGGQSYIPSNYNGQNYGLINMRKALAGSLNVSAVKTLALAGVRNAIDTAKDLGITSDLNADRCGLSLVLGGCEVKLIDHVSAMGVIANSGVRHDQTTILRIEDGQGNVLEEFEESEGEQAIHEELAYQLVDVMTDNDARAFVFGARSPLVLPGRVVAAKTGTTQEWRDGWTLGFTPSLAAGVWAGNNDYSPMAAGADGVFVAAPIWNQFMREALADQPAERFIEPEGIQRVLVDSVSGKLPSQYTPSTKSEVFARSNVPQDYDDVHVVVTINKYNGKLANEITPEEAKEERLFTVIRSEQPDNPAWEGPVRAWAAAAGYGYPPTEEDDGSILFNPDEEVDPDASLYFVTPAEGQEVSLPFSVQVNFRSANPNSVEFRLEGQEIRTVNSAPFSFTITDAAEGWQTLSAHATLSNGSVIQNSIRINIQKP